MLTLLLAGFSVLTGIVIGLFGSITVVVFFSFIAATIIALLMVFVGGSAGTVFIAWVTTIFAVQFGFAVVTFARAVTRTKSWRPRSAGARAIPEALDHAAYARRPSSAISPKPPEHRGSGDA